MELRPADLGGKRAVEIVRQRASTYQSSRFKGRMRNAFGAMRRPQGKPTLNALGRLVTQGSGMDEATAAEAVAATQSMTGGMLGGFLASTAGMITPVVMFASQGNYTGIAIFGTTWALMSTIFVGLPLTLIRKWIHTPLSDLEINHLATENSSSLDRTFAQLIREVTRQEHISPEAEEGLREAIRAIGDAIDRLPPLPASSTVDAIALHQNALTVRVRADTETDAITQASLARQADALERSALAAERSSVHLRRTNALHQELTAQIEALRLGLTAFYTGDADITGLTALSENVRTVAAEATSVAEARTELDSISTYSSASAEPALLNVRSG